MNNRHPQRHGYADYGGPIQLPGGWPADAGEGTPGQPPAAAFMYPMVRQALPPPVIAEGQELARSRVRAATMADQAAATVRRANSAAAGVQPMLSVVPDAPDQVARRDRFLAAHPDVTIDPAGRVRGGRACAGRAGRGKPSFTTAWSGCWTSWRICSGRTPGRLGREACGGGGATSLPLDGPAAPGRAGGAGADAVRT